LLSIARSCQLATFHANSEVPQTGFGLSEMSDRSSGIGYSPRPEQSGAHFVNVLFHEIITKKKKKKMWHMPAPSERGRLWPRETSRS